MGRRAPRGGPRGTAVLQASGGAASCLRMEKPLLCGVLHTLAGLSSCPAADGKEGPGLGGGKADLRQGEWRSPWLKPRAPFC